MGKHISSFFAPTKDILELIHPSLRLFLGSLFLLTICFKSLNRSGIVHFMIGIKLFIIGKPKNRMNFLRLAIDWTKSLSLLFRVRSQSARTLKGIKFRFNKFSRFCFYSYIFGNNFQQIFVYFLSTIVSQTPRDSNGSAGTVVLAVAGMRQAKAKKCLLLCRIKWICLKSNCQMIEWGCVRTELVVGKLDNKKPV